MRNLLALLGALVVVFAVVGWYRGWYNLKTEPDAAGHREVNIDINGLKIKQDLDKGRQKLKGVIDAKAKDGTAQAPQPVPSPIANEGVPPPAVPGVYAPSIPSPPGESIVFPSSTAVPPPPVPQGFRY